MNIPSTIKCPETFVRSAPAGFDGIFDWSWTEGCFNAKTRPMDFDGVVERKGNFLIFETKDLDVPLPAGQRYTLQAAHRLGCMTIMLIHGKKLPERGEIWLPGQKTIETFEGVDEARAVVAWWFKQADRTPQSAYINFLENKITSLENELAKRKARLEQTT